MTLNMATTLGLTRLENPDCQNRIITLACWANTHNAGANNGIRDAAPGFLQIIPYDQFDLADLHVQNRLENMLHSSEKVAIFPFSIIQSGKPRSKFTVPGGVGIIIDSFTPITWPYEIKDNIFNRIDDVCLDQVMRELYTTGPVSIVTKSNNKLLSGVCNIMKDTISDFKYSNVLYYNIYKPNAKDLVKFGEAELRMAFFKPADCLPFFGKNDGGIMHITIVQPDAVTSLKKFLPMIEIVILFTNNTEAFNNVDGAGDLYNGIAPVEKLIKTLKECTFAFDTVGGKKIVAG